MILSLAVTSRGFAAFAEQFIPQWAVISLLGVGAQIVAHVFAIFRLFASSRRKFSRALDAISLASMPVVRFVTKCVSSHAVSLRSIFHYWIALSAQRVFFIAHQFQVGRIATRFVVADKVIELQLTTSETAWYWLNEPCVQQSMRQFYSTIATNTSIAASCCDSKPVPASSLCDLNLGEDRFYGAELQVRNGEILCVSHESAPCAGLWLEPLVAFHRRYGSLHFTAEGVA